ncbi:27726_t:CDS:2, partial [Dentiscutata erythropus]
MNKLSLSTDSAVKSKIAWHLLFSNLRCIQVPLTEVSLVIDLYIFDTVSSGGGSFSEGYTVLSQDCTNNGRLCEGDIKSITLIDENAKCLSNLTLAYIKYLKYSARNGCRKGKCNWKGCIAVFKDKPLNLCDIECCGNHDPEHVRTKPYRMAKVIKKEIASRSTNTTPSILATDNNDVQNAAAKLDDDDVQHAAAELDDDDLFRKRGLLKCHTVYSQN